MLGEYPIIIFHFWYTSMILCMYYVRRWKELELFVSFKKQQLHTAFGIQKYSEDIKETMVCVYVRMYVYA